VIECGEGTGFPLEAGDAVLVLEELLGQDLDGHVALELRVPDPVDLSHSPRTERGEDLPGTETGAGGETQ